MSRLLYSDDLASPLLEVQWASDLIVGRDPFAVSVEGLRAAGHGARPLAAIRKHCLECSGGSRSEVRFCTAVRCDLWPYRLGRDPFHHLRGVAPACGGPRFGSA